MKKSNKITAIYVASSILLFLALLGGGIYGIYLSVGISFMRTNVAMPADFEGGATNVSYAATANFQPSMMGIIILSAALILLSIFYFISLIKQVIFFRQFKLVRESKIQKIIENRVKSKSTVVFFAFVINLLSLIAGVCGIFVNTTSFLETGLSWVLYLIDGFVIIFSVTSFVLLIIKLKMRKKIQEELSNEVEFDDENDDIKDNKNEKKDKKIQPFDIKNFDEVDLIEYILLKLKNMKDGKIISENEYVFLRTKLTGLPSQKRRKKDKTEITD